MKGSAYRPRETRVQRVQSIFPLLDPGREPAAIPAVTGRKEKKNRKKRSRRDSSIHAFYSFELEIEQTFTSSHSQTAKLCRVSFLKSKGTNSQTDPNRLTLNPRLSLISRSEIYSCSYLATLRLNQTRCFAQGDTFVEWPMHAYSEKHKIK